MLNVCGHTGRTHEMCVGQTVSGTDHTAGDTEQSVSLLQSLQNKATTKIQPKPHGDLITMFSTI